MDYGVDESGIALAGLDAVSYGSGGLLAGDARHEYSWRGALWRFASENNRAAFEAHPERYAPQYGGYCELAMSFGKAAHADPHSYRIVDGKVYLSASPAVRFVARLLPGLRSRANLAWARLERDRG